MLERGYLRIGSVRGVPVRLHWTLPLGALVFSGFRFAPVFWFAFFFLVFIHELGHAVLVQRFGHRATSIEITGFGGLCRWNGHASALERAAIAWGGVAAQAALGLSTVLVLLVAGRPSHPALAELAYVFTWTNLWLVGINLLPFPPLDGAEAWKLPALARHARIGDALRNLLPRRRQGRRADRAVVDLNDWAKRQGRPSRRPQHDDIPVDVNKGSPREVADALMRIAEEAARARKGKREN
jgi:Zn-dependent protease